MNVLVSSAGRKVWLIAALRESLRDRSGGHVIAADADPFAAGLQAADIAVVTPRLDDPRHLDVLLDVCDRQAVRLLIPTRDDELEWFAERVELFAASGVQLVVSSRSAIETCRDKIRFVSHCDRHGFETPLRYTERERVRCPAFARHRRGAGSRAVRVLRSAADVAALGEWDEWLVQECIDAPEFTIDYFADREGRAISAVPRERIRVAGGESVVGRTVDAPRLIDASVALAGSLALVGPATLQCFVRDDEPLWIEINARIGGGAALGFAAGARSTDWLVAEAEGDALASCLGSYERDLYMFRASADRFVRAAELRVPLQ
jgi:carbamoyl-phosphate synthase large subunit